jgi:hypothetical protein
MEIRKSINTWLLYNMSFTPHWLRKKLKGKFKRYLEVNENGSTAYQNLWNAAKVVYEGNLK